MIVIILLIYYLFTGSKLALLFLVFLCFWRLNSLLTQSSILNVIIEKNPTYPIVKSFNEINFLPNVNVTETCLRFVYVQLEQKFVDSILLANNKSNNIIKSSTNNDVNIIKQKSDTENMMPFIIETHNVDFPHICVFNNNLKQYGVFMSKNVNCNDAVFEQNQTYLPYQKIMLMNNETTKTIPENTLADFTIGTMPSVFENDIVTSMFLRCYVNIINLIGGMFPFFNLNINMFGIPSTNLFLSSKHPYIISSLEHGISIQTFLRKKEKTNV